MSAIRIFMSFDLENDGDLCHRLLGEASRPGFGFEISARSEVGPVTDRWGESVRRRIAGVDEVIVICGEHTQQSLPVSAELRIIQEEKKPYFLLWGRRERMCTKPAAAKASDSMYSWTEEILQTQITLTLRNSQPLVVPEHLKRPPATRSA